MGTVFRAFDPKLDRDVAVKVMASHDANAVSVERFNNEARAIASLSHPNILQVHDFGEDKGFSYLVMEYLTNGTLQDRLPDGVSRPDALQIIATLSQALDYAHEHKVIHRDVKPANVLMGQDGAPVLSDFGLAKLLQRETRLTASGLIVGTAEYMSPEQALGRAPDKPSDIYSLGVLAYEMVLGRTPFRGKNGTETMLAHIHAEVPTPRSIDPEIDRRLEAALMRVLNKDPDHRFNTAGEFAAAVKGPEGSSLDETGAGLSQGDYTLSDADASAQSPISANGTSSGNLPAQLSSFVGREAEIEQVRGLLETTRLLTLTGFGGAGKTRLALELGRASAEQFRDGVWFHELAPIADPGLLTGEAASLFGIGEDALASYLSDKQLLFIIDNCEHLLVGAASFVQQLLASPGVTVIATSREPLNLAAERKFQVPPLTVPVDGADMESLSGFAAVELFVQRAQAANPDFQLTEETAATVGQIVRRLAGIPLAIELAASRVKLLHPTEIASRLDVCFKFLKGGPIDALPHHQTLERAIDWSYDMLSPELQALFRQLSVFRGGFTLAAFAAINGTEDEYEVLDPLDQLIDKSLVQTERTGDKIRYQLMEPLLQYADARLSADEAEEAKGRHARYYRDLAEQAGPELRGPQQLEWLDRLETEHDNLRAALAWAIDAGDAELAQRTTAALTWFWLVRRHVAEAEEWFDRALAVEGGSPEARASGLVLGGFVRSVVRLIPS